MKNIILTIITSFCFINIIQAHPTNPSPHCQPKPYTPRPYVPPVRPYIQPYPYYYPQYHQNQLFWQGYWDGYYKFPARSLQLDYQQGYQIGFYDCNRRNPYYYNLYFIIR